MSLRRAACVLVAIALAACSRTEQPKRSEPAKSSAPTTKVVTTAKAEISPTKAAPAVDADVGREAEHASAPIPIAGCEKLTAIQCFKKACAGKQGCRWGKKMLAAAAEAYLKGENCPGGAVVAAHGDYRCKVDSQDRSFVSAEGLAVGAFTEAGTEEALLSVYDDRHRCHAEGWRFGQVMRWQDGGFVRALKLAGPTIAERDPDDDSIGEVEPELTGDLLRVLGTFRRADGRDILLVCESGEAMGAEWCDCHPLDLGGGDAGTFDFYLYDDSGDSCERGAKYELFDIISADRKRIGDEPHDDLVVTIETGRGVMTGDGCSQKVLEKTTTRIEVLFDGKRLSLSGPLPKGMREQHE